MRATVEGTITTTTEINLSEILLKILNYSSDARVEELYTLLDNTCVELENELIERGVWEEDE
jgi:hypothetical protein